MTKKAFDKIAAGLEEALAFANGDMTVGRLIVPAEIDVGAIRKKTGLTQKLFANLFGFSLEQVRQVVDAVFPNPIDALRRLIAEIARFEVAAQKQHELYILPILSA